MRFVHLSNRVGSSGAESRKKRQGNGYNLIERNAGSIPFSRARVCLFRYCTHQQLLQVWPSAAVGGVNDNACAAPNFSFFAWLQTHIRCRVATASAPDDPLIYRAFMLYSTQAVFRLFCRIQDRDRGSQRRPTGATPRPSVSPQLLCCVARHRRGGGSLHASPFYGRRYHTRCSFRVYFR